ncbi:MAG: hypothetical protein H3C38_19000 [Rhodospirillales bacterium]|nr:hypothetical protein [Rhodospirillales bacterium]
MTEDILKNLKDDVLKTGFATEMIAASLMREAGWIALDHTYYIDKDENKGREIDIIAIKIATQENEKKRISVNLGLAVEIKRVISKPWIVFTSPMHSEFQISGLFLTSLSRLHFEEIWFSQLYENHRINHLGRLGRASYQAFEKKDSQRRSDEPYIVPTFGALVSAFKAANEIHGHFSNANQRALRDGGKKPMK